MSGLLRFDRSVKRDPAIESWFAAQPDELRALAGSWFDRMRRCGPDVRELLHDGLATVCVGDAPFAYVGVFTAHINIGFFHGANLPDNASLLKGTGRHMRHVKLTPGIDVDELAIGAIITAAYRDVQMRLMADELA